MRLPGLLLGGIGLAVGSAAGVAAYHAAAVAPRQEVAAAYRPPAAVGRPLPAAPPRVEVRTEPCRAPARLRHGDCVTTVVRTLVVHDLPAPTPAAAGVLPGPVGVPAPSVRREDRVGEDRGDRYDGQEDADHAHEDGDDEAPEDD